MKKTLLALIVSLTAVASLAWGAAQTGYFDGITSSSGQTLTINETTSPIAKANVADVNSRAAAHSLIVTAAASGSNGVIAADDDDLDMATNNFGWFCLDAIPDLTPAANIVLAQKTDGTNGWVLSLLTTGYLRLTLNVTTYDSTATLASMGFSDNQAIFPHFSVTRESASSAGSVVFGANGRQCGNSVAITSGAPTTVSNASPLYIMGTSSTRTAGATSLNGLTNFAPTIAEWLQVYQGGPYIPGAWQWGSQAGIAASDPMSADLTANWDLGDATLAFDTDHYEITGAGVNATITSDADYTALEAGKKYRMSIDVKDGTASGQTMRISTATTGSGAFVTRSDPFTTTASWVTQNFEFTAVGTERRNHVQVTSNMGGNNVEVKNFKVAKIGATLALEQNGIQPAPGQWIDSTSNKNHAMQPVTGSFVSGILKDYEYRWTNTWTASSAAQYIGGQNQAILSTKHFITSIVSRATVTTDVENIEIGDGSVAAYYVAAVAPTAAPIIHTLAKNLNDGTNLKLVVTPAAEATMTVEFIVKGYLLE